MFVYSADKSKLYVCGEKDENVYVDYPPAGVYRFDVERGLFSSRSYFAKSEYDKSLIEINGAPFDMIKKKVLSFCKGTSHDVYKDFSVSHFMGCLLYGPPGTGKTGLVEWLAKKLVKEQNAIAIRVTTDVRSLPDIIKIARKDSSRLIIFIFEELDKLLNYTNEQFFLTFTDGDRTPDNVLMLATTNNFMDLPPSIRDRPSRFAVCEEIINVPTEILASLVNSLTPLKYQESDTSKFSEITFKLSEKGIKIDQVKHVLLNVFAHGATVDDAILAVQRKS